MKILKNIPIPPKHQFEPLLKMEIGDCVEFTSEDSNLHGVGLSIRSSASSTNCFVRRDRPPVQVSESFGRLQGLAVPLVGPDDVCVGVGSFFGAGKI